MYIKNLRRTACLAVILAALVMSAGRAKAQNASLRISVAEDTPTSQIATKGAINFKTTKLVFEFQGTVSLRGVTIKRQGLGVDQDLSLVSFTSDPDQPIRIVWGSGVLENGVLDLYFGAYSTYTDQTVKMGILVNVAEDAQAGNAFSLGIVDVAVEPIGEVVIIMPKDGAFGNIMTIGPVEIGELKVVAYQESPVYAIVGAICYPTGGILQNSEIEPVIVSDVAMIVDGDFVYGDLEQLSISIGDSGVVRLGPVEPGAIYHFDGNWFFDKGQEQTFKISIFVKSGAEKKFSVSVIDIVARGQNYGFQIPVEGLPICGDVIKIIPSLPELPNFYGWIYNLKTGNPIENTLIMAIHEESKKRTKALSRSDGYYVLENLEPGAYWLIAVQQGYRANVQPALAEEGESVQVDFWLKPR